MWTLHATIPDMRNISWNKCVKFKDKNRTINTKYLFQKYGLEYKHCKNNSSVVFNTGNFYHHYKKNGDTVKYFINIDLVKEVVGDNKPDIDGYVFGLLAYGFFDRNVRKSLKANNMKKRLFVPTKDTCIHDTTTIKQYKKTFHAA